MRLIDRLRLKVAKWPYPVITIMGGLSAFGTYTCMYAFRKGYTAATFDGMQYLHVDFAKIEHAKMPTRG